MINEDKLAEFLEQHKRNPENFNNEGNYDPNPYWLAEDIVKLFAIHNVVVPKGTLCPTCGEDESVEDESVEDWQTYYRCKLCDTKF